MTDFSFHSIGIAMQKLDRADEFLRFIDDVFIDGAVTLLGLNPEESKEIVGTVRKFKLDFDDAYQYVAATKHGLVLVSFDADFDRTALKRRTPGEITG